MKKKSQFYLHFFEKGKKYRFFNAIFITFVGYSKISAIRSNEGGR